jgi:hypothetical protein
MRYLKRYNESVESRNELLEFCNDRLALLLDEGYYLRVDKGDDKCTIAIRKRIVSSAYMQDNKSFNFNDVKDEFIPFYEMLKDKYELVDIYRGESNYPCYVELMTGDDEHMLSDEQVLNSEYEYKDVICIFIIVKI